MPEQPSHDALVGIASDAFVFGCPLVLMDVSRAVMTSVSRPGPGKAPSNSFGHLGAFPDASFTDVVSPNADTLYSMAWLDLSEEPIVLSVPASEGRYYLMPLLSAWTDVFASPGTRTTGNGAGEFAIVGPGWAGEFPAGLRSLRSPTSMAWLIGRTQTNGVADYSNVHRFQNALRLTPLSRRGTAWTPPDDVPVESGIDAVTSPPKQLWAMDGATFFGRLAALMVDNPPSGADAPALAEFEAIGLRPGSFEPGAEALAALDEGVKHGHARIVASKNSPVPPTPTGWTIFSGLGSYGTQYAKRALVALIGLGANLDEDAIYPHATVDDRGEPLTGAHRYLVHFEPGETPPANAFWSLTMYNDRQFFVENPIGRYAIGDRDALLYDHDGALDLWICHERPAAELVPNWLPAPAGSFNMFLRVYSPKQEVLDGDWMPPPVQRLEH